MFHHNIPIRLARTWEEIQRSSPRAHHLSQCIGETVSALQADPDRWHWVKPHGYGSIPINTIFRGMNIHLPAILMFTRGIGF